MATLYKRKNSTYWQIEFTGPDGKRIQRTAGTADERAARELAAQLEHDAWRQAKLKDRPRRTWQEAATRWLKEHEHKRSLDEDKKSLRWLHPYLHGVYLDALTPDLIARIRDDKRKTVKPETANRTLAVLRAVLNTAVKEWQWIDTMPYIRLFTPATQRLRWLTADEAARLLQTLPPHLAEMARFTLATGLRESNVTGLTWAQVDLARKCCWIHADQSKSKKPISIPLNEDALACLRRQNGKHPETVFTYDGQPVTRCNTAAWRKALARAGIKLFRWHDLRHTWATWHIQNGTPPHILKELGGWSDLKMVERYAHLSPAHLAEYADGCRQPVTLSLTLVKATS